jgi:hypothetical protein
MIVYIVATAWKALESHDRLLGSTYDSNFEADYAAELDRKRRGGLIKSLASAM